MSLGPEPVALREIDARGGIPDEVFAEGEPLVLRGLVADWPAVAACSGSIRDAAEYLSRFWTREPVTAYVGDAAMGGRFFYDDSFTSFNFRSGQTSLDQVFERLADSGRPSEIDSIYVGSTPVDRWLPGFRDENDIEIPADDSLISFWLGSATRVSAHYDFPDNVACVVAGERRFILFPPEQVANLYVGPLDRTPSGQAISLVDFDDPDHDRFPRFREAMEHARVADLKPGDAIFVPSMWWHHVEALAPFNLLVNYWWCDDASALGSPVGALMHALLTLRQLPERQRRAWRSLFDHYVFDADEQVYAHIPEAARGCLAPLDESAARRLRAELLNRLNQ